MQSLVLAAIVHTGNVLVIEERRGPRFRLETRDALRIGRGLGRKDFESHRPAELHVSRANHRRHAAGADRLDEFEMPEPSSAQIV
jgi:hypothetical protein